MKYGVQKMTSKNYKANNKSNALKIVFITLLCISVVSYIIYYFNNIDITNDTETMIKHDNSVKANQKIERKKTEKNVVYLFYLPTCGYCHRAMSFIESNLKSKYKNINFKYINVSLKDGRELYFKIKSELNIMANGVPVVVIGKKYFVGFGDNTGYEYIKAIESELSK